jgi:hypothetical protein
VKSWRLWWDWHVARAMAQEINTKFWSGHHYEKCYLEGREGYRRIRLMCNSGK